MVKFFRTGVVPKPLQLLEDMSQDEEDDSATESAEGFEDNDNSSDVLEDGDELDSDQEDSDQEGSSDLEGGVELGSGEEDFIDD